MRFAPLSALILILVCFLPGCRLGKTVPITLNCPEPAENCLPGSWSGVAADTSVKSAKDKGYYYRISRVKNINTADDEMQLAFHGSNKALLTYTNNSIQNMIDTRRVMPDRLSTESGIHIPLEGHTGLADIEGDDIYFSFSPKFDIPDSLIFDKSGGRILVPYQYRIGQTAIYKGKFIDGRAESLEQIISMDSFFVSQPAVYPGGKALFFVSDMPGTYGGTDIWFILNENGRWSDPVNCGPLVNSQCDELSPFISKDGTELYFSSAGHETVGGYDIFKAAILPGFDRMIDNPANEHFVNVKNLKPPVNTPYDELFPSSPAAVDSILYYTSNQAGYNSGMAQSYGGFDIYVREIIYLDEFIPDEPIAADEDSPEPAMADEPAYAEPRIAVPDSFLLTGKVYREESSKPVEGAEVTVRDEPGSETEKSAKTDISGEYEFNLEKNKPYRVTAQSDTLFFDSELIIYNEKSDTLKKNLYLPSKLILRINFPTDEFSNPYRYVLDSNGISTNRSWEEELDRLAKNIRMSEDIIDKIILVGHTDDIASHEYNFQLGKRRVDFVISQLVRRGIPAYLLEGRSAGETEKLKRRQNENLELYRKRLRRVSIEKILKK
ncbi:MAG: carboxypeptidase regulatory-like domain-containing protein [Bacteroidota bacterium]